MTSLVAPHPITSSKDSSYRRPSLSDDCCYFPNFCKIFAASNEDSDEKHVPDLKVLAQNSINTCGTKQVNGSNETVKQPGKCPITTDGTQTKSILSLSDITHSGNRSSKEEVDNGEKLLKQKPTYVYRVMQKDMKVEKNRLETFQSTWPLSYINPSDLAAVGFFYLQCGDKVQCAFCRGIIVDWAPGDDPLTEHTLHFPLCPFLLNRDVGNVSASGKSPFAEQYNNSHPENSEVFRRGSFRAEGPGGSRPKFCRMESKEARLSTFRNWQYTAVQPDALVNAGFFYTGTSDIATCFYCGGTLGHWDLGDDPLLEHKKHFPHCAYLKSMSCSTTKKSFNAVEDNVPEHTQISQTYDINEIMKSEPCTEAKEIFSEKLVREALERQLNKKGQGFQSLEDLCSTILEIQDETQKDTNQGVESRAHVTKAAGLPSDRHMCKICWDKEMGIVFIPCGHMVACPECTLSLTNCPLCRKTIESTVRAYMS